ncbi:MAG: L-threonylcarbamoyladenylate synthase [bacterium]
MDFFSIEEAAWHLRNGSVVAYPTETVFGLGSVIFDKDAVMRIKKLKGISPEKPVSVLISNNNRDMVEELVEELTPVAQRLVKFFWPGPLTIVHKCKPSIPGYIHGNSNFIGMRCSSFPLLNNLIDLVGHPIVSTSANLTGQSPATSYEDVFNYFSDDIDGVISFDMSLCSEKSSKPDKIPSTIIKVDTRNFEIIREGALKKEQIFNKIYD